jgi:hypothetical protein
MSVLPSSPRARRRLFTVAGIVAVAAVAGAIVLAVPSSKPGNPAPKGNEGPAQLAARVSKHVSAVDRKAIDATLDQFIPAAVGRRNATLAWSLAGPELRSGSTLADWKRNITPVPSYPVGDPNYHGWGVLDATKDEVDFNLLVHPRKGSGQSSDWVFQGVLVKRDGHWLVNRIYTTAIMAKPDNGFKEVGPADFAAPGASTDTPQGAAPIGRRWLVVLLAGLVVGILTPTAVGGLLLLRGRRRARNRAEGDAELPPLPSSVRSGRD